MAECNDCGEVGKMHDHARGIKCESTRFDIAGDEHIIVGVEGRGATGRGGAESYTYYSLDAGDRTCGRTVIVTDTARLVSRKRRYYGSIPYWRR